MDGVLTIPFLLSGTGLGTRVAALAPEL
jgi:hypothetical protein